MLIIDTEKTRALLPFEQLVPALAQAFREEVQVPLRHNHAIHPDSAMPGCMLLMPAWNNQGFLGIKTVTIYPQNAAVGLPGLHSTYMLHSATTGAPLALIDGNEITSRRTAAASALAADYLSRAQSSSLLVVGAGRVASLLPYAYRVIRPIQRVAVWDINPAQATRLVDQLQADGFEAQVADDLGQACAAADIVTCATLSTTPLIRREWLKPGTHLDLIGGFTPLMRESDDACFDGTEVFIDTAEAPMKAGDLLSPLQSGVLQRTDIRADLAALCRDLHPGRTGETQITVFKAVGTALEDLAAAQLVYLQVTNN
ncbi:ornithine cyclodeaminase family protein [Pseudomonas sp. MWU16-30317]|uniref:ornithine cyclodeaminase family protein n=1 Tax=Pseudomonas sp. MWU16-30317 TaxID=2878095 RepID=UPI001CFAC11F|nr:ornithine cyclodeaminase family protein [Pseudomonas sp. MWU16-30317]